MSPKGSYLIMYEQIGYIMIGLIAVFVLILDFYLYAGHNLLQNRNWIYFIFFLVSVYFLGNVLDEVARYIYESITLNRNKWFSKQDLDVMDDFKKRFGLKKHSLKDLYSICYMYALSRDMSGQVKRFNFYHIVHRGWFAVFLLNALFLLLILIMDPYINADKLWFDLSMFLLSFLLAVFFFITTQKFYIYRKEKTLQTYLIFGKDYKEKKGK